MLGRGWTVEQEIVHVDEQLARVAVAIREARANDDHSLAENETTRDGLLDLRSLLVMQRGPSE